MKLARVACVGALFASGCSLSIDFGALDAETGTPVAGGASSRAGSSGASLGGADGGGQAGATSGGASGIAGASTGGASAGDGGSTSGASGIGGDASGGGAGASQGGASGSSASGGAEQGGTSGAGGSNAGSGGSTSGASGEGGSSGAAGTTGGAGGSPVSPTDLAMSQQSPLGLTVDATYVYWVATKLPGIFRVAKTGGAAQRLDVVDDDLSDPFDVAVDGDQLFWSEYTPNIIRGRAMTDGTATDLATGSGFVAYLAIAGGKIFATDYQTALPTVGSVVTASESGGGANVLYDTEPYASGIAAIGTTLAWGRSAGDIILGKVTGGNEMTTLDMAGTVGGVAMDADEIFYLQDQQRIIRVNRTTLDTGTFYEAAAPFGNGDVALDDTYVYWTEPMNGLVRQLAR